ncbi:WG repeat-containing protein [Myroides odoratus]|uniref:WG repeat-containing protein n=1 Tax=Myroides odoratus TaxID=256 RepID=A0A9Q7EA44_MYROD|nr:WG repeat-containing protein [Myroides odoratus]EHQ42061.1 hypothetical protein Myrod_1228 [Myroides odoratus DSM 2801]EKB09159.1 hypothetical protein HMPREF9716_00264 [Myroides odoratus CIP 103059]QQT99448.1 WG repeat-containing protein [Myroides odoratus]WQD58348.1 WG repeat-containing protein [Myroides odoratus]STZ29323.1 KWG Leptospira [Myroides odoratus]
MKYTLCFVFLSLSFLTPTLRAQVKVESQLKNGFALVSQEGKYGIINDKGVEVTPMEYDDIAAFKDYGEEGSFFQHEGFYIVRKSEKYGVVNDQGEVVIPVNYDAVSADLMSKEDLFIVSDKGKYGIINGSNKRIIPLVYDHVRVSNDFFIAKKDGKYGILKKGNKVVLPFVYDDVSTRGTNFIVVNNGKKGVVNQKNKIVIPIIYDEVRNFHEAFIVTKEKKQGILNAKGKVNIPLEYDWINTQQSGGGKIITHLKGKKGMIDYRGKVILPAIYDVIADDFNAGYLIVSLNKKFGIMTAEGELITPFAYNFIQNRFARGYAIVDSWDRENGKKRFGVVNLKGELTVPVEYSVIEDVYKQNLVQVWGNGRNGVIDPTTGQIIVPVEFINIDESKINLTGKMVVVKNKEGSDFFEMKANYYDQYNSSYAYGIGKPPFRKRELVYGVIDRHGNTTIPLSYQKINFYDRSWLNNRGAHFEVYTDEDKMGLLDIEGKVILPPIYDAATVFFDDDDNIRHIVVVKEGYTGICNEKGDVILPVNYDKIVPLDKNSFAVQKNNTIGIIDPVGNFLQSLRYTSIEQMSYGEGLYKCVLEGKKGALSIVALDTLTVKNVIPNQFDKIEELSYLDGRVQCVKVEKDGCFGVYSREGAIILPVAYDQIEIQDGQTIWGEKQGKYGIVKTNGEVLLPLQSNANLKYDWELRKWVLLEGDTWRTIEEQ